MKILKSVLVIVILCASNVMFAKITTGVGAKKPTTPSTSRGRGRVPAPTPTPTPTPAVKTFQQLVNKVIKNTNPAVAWNNDKKILNPAFADDIAENALAIGLEGYQLDALLQLARDKYAIFTNNPEEDKNILTKLAQERKALVEWFNMGKKEGIK